MKRWSLVLPTLYFLFLFLLALLNIPRKVSRPLTWIEVGGIVFMVILVDTLKDAFQRWKSQQ